MAGANLIDSPWKYVPVRRTTDFIEQSLLQSLKWAAFEPNAAPLWASISLEVNAFMSALYGEGAFDGMSAAQAYQVVCDGTTTSPANQLAGVVNVHVGFRPVEPAEFVVLTVQLNAGPSPAAS
jgi:phage tail sheath protein FI